MALKLKGQTIEMFPLESRFIKCDRLGQMVGDEIDFGSLQNAERCGLDLLKRGVMWETLIGEQLEDLGRFLQVLVAFPLQLVYTFLRYLFRAIMILSDVINQAVDEIVVQFLIAVVDKTEQIDTNRLLVELLEQEHVVIRHQ